MEQQSAIFIVLIPALNYLMILLNADRTSMVILCIYDFIGIFLAVLIGLVRELFRCFLFPKEADKDIYISGIEYFTYCPAEMTKKGILQVLLLPELLLTVPLAVLGVIFIPLIDPAFVQALCLMEILLIISSYTDFWKGIGHITDCFKNRQCTLCWRKDLLPKQMIMNCQGQTRQISLQGNVQHIHIVLHGKS